RDKEKYQRDKEKNCQFPAYDYTLNKRDSEQKVESLLKKINEDNKDIDGDRMKEILKESRDDIIQEVKGLIKILNDARDKVAEELKDEVREAREVLIELKTNLKNLDLVKYLDDLKQKIEEAKWEILIFMRSEEHTSELQSRENLVCRLL